MGSVSINSYNRRDSFGLGWADQWDYKFNDEKLAATRAKTCNNSKLKGKLGKENTFSDTKTTSNYMQKNQQHHHTLLNKKKLMELNRKVLSAANSSAVVAKEAANAGAHKMKAGTSMGVKWLKKQCSMKALK
ncbi:hypothetical protein GOP47_0011874 [Adiantum capillus-veneris]|uniref:Uncharacterized protein n=1 Tax=Adiantum capillus-veneris TaxID=13818 RepID=A0A9D4UU28_ADICA|nr:hypothetical protein GOP47_0011874 [Adiantum capillus-veneris]